MQNLILRTFSGILLVMSVLFFSLKGGLLLLISTIVLSLIASTEFHKAVKNISVNYPLWLQIALSLSLNIASYYKLSYVTYFILALAVMISLIFVALGNKYTTRDMLGFLLSFLYCNFLINFFILFDEPYKLIIVYLCSWGSDTFAYLIGMLFGKHKLIEKLSPNKTIEGSIGGLIASTILVVIYTKYLGFDNTLLWALSAFVMAILSQIGDLCASYIKRITGIKDFGNVILGHGGVLDRFDSVIFVLPIAYFITSLIGG